MSKYRAIFQSFLKRDLSWAYQEIVAEASVVLWVTCQLCVTLATRILPSWRPTRSASWDATYFDGVLSFLGYGLDGCFWHRVAFHWREPVEGTQNSRFSSIFFGHIGISLSLGITATFFLWFAGYLFANRHWRLPQYTSHHLPLCHSLSRYFGQAYNDSPYVINAESESEAGGDPQNTADAVQIPISTASSSALQADQRLAYSTINDIPYRWRGALKIGFLGGVIMPLTCLSIFLWGTFLTIPLVWLAEFVTRIIVLYYGEAAIFPCCVFIITALSIYCWGRMWGLWMRESYLWALWNKIRLLCGWRPPALVLDACPRQCEMNESNAKLVRIGEVWFGLFAYGAAVLFNVYPLYETFPQISIDAWKPVTVTFNCVVNLSLEFQMLTPKMAVLSHWVDESYLLENWLENDTYATSFREPLVISPVTGIVLMYWSGTVTVLAVLAMIPPIVALVLLPCIMASADQAPQPPRQRCNETTNFCGCAMWMPALRFLIIIIARPLMWYLLPWPVMRFLLPEHLQLPGMFFLSTTILAWAYYEWIRYNGLQWRFGAITSCLCRFFQRKAAHA
ncbi:uncharacterized protein LOC129592951 [Paramacrobiotus metropolitanus]|uniref:uncharacterized protein LOC129592951 n=1 Tax=Paramacrobiotus metropolitanus TaxID=2943436 RepID=UPI0024465648|nr:uncharacterized protein LOC129592951 [Paramacrobiotus metropolitanus]